MFYNIVIFFAAYREGSRGTLAAFTGLFSVLVEVYKNLFDNSKLKRVVHLIINTLLILVKVYFKGDTFVPDIPVTAR